MKRLFAISLLTLVCCGTTYNIPPGPTSDNFNYVEEAGRAFYTFQIAGGALAENDAALTPEQRHQAFLARMTGLYILYVMTHILMPKEDLDVVYAQADLILKNLNGTTTSTTTTSNAKKF